MQLCAVKVWYTLGSLFTGWHGNKSKALGSRCLGVCYNLSTNNLKNAKTTLLVQSFLHLSRYIVNPWLLPSYLSILTESCFQISCSCHRWQIAHPQTLASFFLVLCWRCALAWCFGCLAVCSFRVFAFSFTCFALCFLISGTEKNKIQETMEMWRAMVFTHTKALYRTIVSLLLD